MAHTLRPAPGALELPQSFVNTAKLLYGQEEIVTADDLRDWLVARDVLDSVTPVTADGLRLALATREALRALMFENTTGDVDRASHRVLDDVLVRAAMRPRLLPGPRVDLVTPVKGVEGALAQVLAPVVVAIVDGSWSRVKACASRECQWVFYDRSANASGSWCRMNVCGARAKMREYRRRGAASAG
jgi:predicted RNA-binding Zn ribbon-like protein